MKIYFFILFSICSLTIQAQKKNPLLIGICSYDLAVSGWKPLSSAREGKMLRQSPVNSGNFDSTSIRTLVDGEATKENIEAAIAALTRRADQGDVVFIHISSHGIQLQDDGSDEMDKFDEAIVPIDAIAPKHLRDPEYATKQK